MPMAVRVSTMPVDMPMTYPAAVLMMPVMVMMVVPVAVVVMAMSMMTMSMVPVLRLHLARCSDGERFNSCCDQCAAA